MKKLVVITGASSGIGAATARMFSKNNYPLLLLARRIDHMKSLGLEHCVCKKIDVTDLEALKGAVSEAEDTYGPVECLVNNAGVMYLGRPWEQDVSEWQAMVDVNLIGVMNGIHATLPDMVKRNSGTIINISSLAGRKTFQRHAVYCATKSAVHSLSETIRGEVANQNVRVITIAPGAVETELISHTTKSQYQQEWWDGLGGILKADDVARAILFAYEQPQTVCLREIVITPTGSAG